MDKSQAIYSFWASFGIDAYDANTVPDDASLPYITYNEILASFDSPVTLTATIWYRSNSWVDISRKAEEIARFVSEGYLLPVDETGFLWVTEGTPFAQRRSDSSDSSVRGIYIILNAEFLTAY